MHASIRVKAFRLAAVFAAFAAAYHTAAVVVPAFATIAYPATYPVWRHLVFIAIGGSLVWLFLRRPIWLVWPYAVLTAQVIYSHGGAAWTFWQQERRIDWISIAAVVGILLGLGLLLVDWRERRAAAPAASATAPLR
jgi:hypothetical protein